MYFLLFSYDITNDSLLLGFKSQFSYKFVTEKARKKHLSETVSDNTLHSAKLKVHIVGGQNSMIFSLNKTASTGSASGCLFLALITAKPSCKVF